jgi:hypothetical protein
MLPREISYVATAFVGRRAMSGDEEGRMSNFLKRARRGVAGALLLFPVATPPVLAQSGLGADGAERATTPTVVLTPEEIVEREARKDCKVRICAALHGRKPEAPDVACSVLKSWRKEQLTKMLQKAKVSWPWGDIRCTADVRLKGGMLARATTEDRYEAKLDTHKVVCKVAREGADAAEINFEFTPVVTFEKGKAVKAVLGWGKVQAPTLIKGAMWTATATDNTFNVLQGTVVEDINDFIGPKCDEVKSDWAGK